MEASGGSGSLFVQVLDWLWLPILSGAVIALLSVRGWRHGVDATTRACAGLVVVLAAAELVWRLLFPATVLPLAAWAGALFVLALAREALERATTTPGRQEEESPAEEPPASPPADDPFRFDPPAAPEATPGAPVNESWASLAFDQTQDALAAFDLDGRLILVNPAWAQLHGYRADDVSGHRVSLFHTPEQMRRQLRPWMVEVRETSFRQGESRHRKKDGTTFGTRSSLTLLRGGDAQPIGFLMACLDPFREAAPEARSDAGAPATDLAHDMEVLRILAGSVGHELNNSLTGIMGNASLIQQKGHAGLEEEVREIESASKEAAELSRLLQSYAGRSAYPQVESLLLSDLAKKDVQHLEAVVTQVANLRYEMDDAKSLVSVDAAQFRILLRNLVANAAEAAGSGGCEITVGTGSHDLDRQTLDTLLMGALRSPGPYAYLEVADTGQGLPAEEVAKIFQPFYTTRSGKKGLGLTAVRSIVRAHRGVISVESRQGGGTRIRVYLPTSGEASTYTAREDQRPRHPVAAPKAPEPLRETRPPGEGTILIVDNEEIIRNLAEAILVGQGYDVLTAEEGEPALELFRAHHDDLAGVLLDLSMPIMDGSEVFEEIRRLDPAMPIVLMTGHDAYSVRRSFEKLGGFEEGRLSAVLQKPFKPVELLSTLRAILS